MLISSKCFCDCSVILETHGVEWLHQDVCHELFIADAAKKGTASEGADKIEKSEEERKKEEEKREEDRKKAIAEPRKAIVVDRSAFNAFSYFDQNLCGYVIRLIFPHFFIFSCFPIFPCGKRKW